MLTLNDEPDQNMIETPPLDIMEFDRLRSTSQLVVVHFWAPWNGYDYLQDRHLRDVRSVYADRIVFYSCNIDVETALALNAKIANVPAIAGYRRGLLIGLRVGVSDPPALIALLENWLSEDGDSK